jgi:hypothetical protein
MEDHCRKLRVGRMAILLFMLLPLIGPSEWQAAEAADSCKFVQEASLPASFNDGEVLVDVVVNGAPAKFRIDTLSSYTQISRSMASASTCRSRPART